MTPKARNVEISIPPGNLLAPDAPIAISPDGSAIVFGTIGPAMSQQLWVRRLDRFDTVPLEGTQNGIHPFWSPDSKSIAFFVMSEGTLRRLDLTSGTSQIISKVTTSVLSGLRLAGFARGGSWGTDGTILFTPNSNAPIMRVPAAGGEPVDVTKLDQSILDGSHRFPVFLPDGQHFIFTLWSNHAETAAKVGGIYLASLEKGVLRKLTPDVSQALLAANDQLLVHRNGNLVALPFDPVKLQIKEGEAVVVQHPMFHPPAGALSAGVSTNGDLAFALSAGESTGQLAWLDRNGTTTGAIGYQRIAMRRLVVSPGGKRFAAQVEGTSGAEIWVGDTEREVLTRLTRGSAGSDTTNPVWSLDESRVAFASKDVEGNIVVYIQPGDGNSPPQILISNKDRDFLPSGWSNDGRFLFVDSGLKNSIRSEVWLYDFTEKKLRPILTDSSASIRSAVPSPDGHWLAYVSDESGNEDIFVRPFPALDRKWQLSNSGGEEPHWRNDGREIIFVAPDLSLQFVKIEIKENDFEATPAAPVFASKAPTVAIAPSPDHSRFLAAVVSGDVRAEPIHLILNWKQTPSQ